MYFIIYSYFSSMLNRFFVLLFMCSFVSLILFDTSIEDTRGLFVDLIAFSMPWFLLFHHSYFAAFNVPKKALYRLFVVLGSTIISTILLIVLFPLSQKKTDVTLNNINSKVITSFPEDIMTFDSGTLILNAELDRYMIAKDNTISLWIGSNYLLFSQINTNQSNFILSDPETFTSFGYYSQEGDMAISYEDFYGTIPLSNFAYKILQQWLTNVSVLNKSLVALYKSVDISVYIFKTKVDLAIYIDLFLRILCICAVISLIGVLLTLGQKMIGIAALLLIVSFYLADIVNVTLEVSTQLYAFYSTYSMSIINLIVLVFLYLLYIIIGIIKNKLRGARY